MSTAQLKVERVIAYIDGFNLYFGLRDADLECYKWLNIIDLSTKLLKPHQPLIHTKYFTSRISSPAEKVARQSTYLDAITTLQNISIVYGKYTRDKEIECAYCGSTTSHAQEKMTDVNIAVAILEDAYQDAFDTALLISGDSDLCPPLRTIRRLFPRKRIIVAFPPARISTDLRQSLVFSSSSTTRGSLRNNSET